MTGYEELSMPGDNAAGVVVEDDAGDSFHSGQPLEMARLLASRLG